MPCFSELCRKAAGKKPEQTIQRFSARVHIKISWGAFKAALVPRLHPGGADLIELSCGLGIYIFLKLPGESDMQPGWELRLDDLELGLSPEAAQTDVDWEAGEPASMLGEPGKRKAGIITTLSFILFY